MNARYIVGDVLEVLEVLEPGSVDCIVTSPPYLKQRRYGDGASEIGQEATPADFLDALLDVMDACYRVLADDGTFWVNLGDKHAGSGGAGGDYNEGGLRAGQPRYGAVRAAPGWPANQSVCWLPELFGASLSYGRNLLNGTDHQQWITRPGAVWWKPRPMPGSSGRKFKTATELIVYGGKRQEHYWNITPLLEPLADAPGNKYVRRMVDADREMRVQGDTTANAFTADYDPTESDGKVPHNVWVIDTVQYPGAHFAVFPPELVVKPITVGCRPGGTVLDPFAGSGTTLAVATGHGLDCIGIDLYDANADLARERVGMFLTVEHLHRAAEAV